MLRRGVESIGNFSYVKVGVKKQAENLQAYEKNRIRYNGIEQNTS